MIRQFVITLAESAAELCTTLIRRELADSATGGVSPGEFFLLEVCSVSCDLGSGCGKKKIQTFVQSLNCALTRANDLRAILCKNQTKLEMKNFDPLLKFTWK